MFRYPPKYLNDYDPGVVMAGDTSRSNWSELDEVMFTNFRAFQNNLHICHHIYTVNMRCKYVALQAVIPQPYRPNRYETDIKRTTIIKFANFHKLSWQCL